VPQPGDVGVVLDVTLLEEFVEADGQCHQPTDPRDAADERWWGSGLWLVTDRHPLAAVASRREVHPVLDRDITKSCGFEL
jgi:hypothetical protein